MIMSLESLARSQELKVSIKCFNMTLRNPVERVNISIMTAYLPIALAGPSGHNLSRFRPDTMIPF